ncbi:hypothetical protein COR50_07520 [Chitinophaga caeni]|uniref:Outer membrane protein beta-barrel domain-containing protein n=1 Tax=Chitinophaga caeni TaxID=2029983 RepID=A0A291QT80_9BACT|nr:porin family protein [Chitinophaga caeni]ATL47044.1 hypothetical protein COR50_07520 [Chitinophaga caeni]
MVNLDFHVLTRKRIYFFPVVLMVLIILTGQQANAQGFSRNMSKEIGKTVRLGFTLSPLGYFMNPQESGVDRYSGRMGLSFGVMADFFLDDNANYAISSGLEITSGGSTLKYNDGIGLDNYKDYPSEYDLRLQYLQIPLTLKLCTYTQSGLGIYGQFGGFFAAPIRARADVISNGVKYEKENVLKTVNPLNAGMLLGAGVEYPLTETMTGVVGITYQNGLIDVTRNSKWNDGRINGNLFALRLGLYF